MSIWCLLSWLAVILGWLGTWLAGRHRNGWLVGVACCVLWLAYDVYISLWSAVLAALVGVALNMRNFHLGRMEAEQ